MKNRFGQKLFKGLVLSLVCLIVSGTLIIGGCSNAGPSKTSTSSTPTTQSNTTSVAPATSSTQSTTSPATTKINTPNTSITNPATSSSKPPTSTPSSTSPQIVAKEFSFIPQTITVAVGTTITWINDGSEEHTVSSDTGIFSGVISPGKTFSYTFTTAGVFNYHCGIHPEMIGTVTVK